MPGFADTSDSLISTDAPPIQAGQGKVKKGKYKSTFGGRPFETSVSPNARNPEQLPQDMTAMLGGARRVSPTMFPQTPPAGGRESMGGGGGDFGGAGTISGMSSPSMMSGRANDMLSSFFGRDIGALGGRSIDRSMENEGIGRDMWQREHGADLNQRYIQQAMLMNQLQAMPREQAMRLLETLGGSMGSQFLFNPAMHQDPRLKAMIDSAAATLGAGGAPTPGGQGQGQGQGQQPGEQQPTDPTQPGQPAAAPQAGFFRSALHSAAPTFASMAPFLIPAVKTAASRLPGPLGPIAQLAMSVGAGVGANKLAGAVDPSYSGMQPNVMGQGAGVLGSLLGGPRLFRGIGGIPPLEEAEAQLESATGGQPRPPTPGQATAQGTAAAEGVAGGAPQSGPSGGASASTAPPPQAPPGPPIAGGMPGAAGFGAQGPVMAPPENPQMTGFGAQGPTMTQQQPPPAAAPAPAPVTQPMAPQAPPPVVPQAPATPAPAPGMQSSVYPQGGPRVPIATNPVQLPPQDVEKSLLTLGFTPEQAQQIVQSYRHVPGLQGPPYKLNP